MISNVKKYLKFFICDLIFLRLGLLSFVTRIVDDKIWTRKRSLFSHDNIIVFIYKRRTYVTYTRKKNLHTILVLARYNII